MKAQKLFFSFSQLLSLTTLLLSLSCSKEMPAELSDAQRDELYLIKDFKNAGIVAETEEIESAAQVSSIRNPLKASSEIAEVKVSRISNLSEDDRINRMVQNLVLQAIPGNQYQTSFKIDKSNLTLFIKVANLSGLSEEQIIMAEQNTKEDGLYMVPVAQYPIDSIGVLRLKRNDLGEETRQFEFVVTPLTEATYIKISNPFSGRIRTGLAAKDVSEQNQIFLKKNLDNQYYSGNIIKRSLNRNQLKLADEAIVFSELATDDKLSLWVMTPRNQLTADQERALKASLESGIADPNIRDCNQQDLKKATPQLSASLCVMVRILEVKISYVSVVPKVQEGVVMWSDVDLLPSSASKARLVKIELTDNVLYQPWESNNRQSPLDPKNYLIVADFANKEFLYRRTLIDSPNLFDYLFTGLAGNLMTVKFDFEENQVVVRRSRPVLPKEGASAVDLEPLMSLPVTYFRRVKYDANGNILVIPRYVGTTNTNKEAIALIDWSSNVVPKSLSPLNRLGLMGICFSGNAYSSVEDVAFDSEQGQYGFTLTSNYTPNMMIDCVGSENAGYFDDKQDLFTFKERVSFQVYMDGQKDQNGQYTDQSPLLNIPYRAQKRLGFGLFTYNRKQPNELGNVAVEGTEIPLPAVFDVRGNKQIEYVLAGIPKLSDNPEQNQLREMLILATKDVIADLNRGFKQAFKGLPSEFSGRTLDVITLKVEGLSASEQLQYGLQNANEMQLGDFGRNYIWYEQKGTKSLVIGLGGSHSNPHNGRVENASVFLYGGNIKSYIQYMRDQARARVEYRKQMAQKSDNEQPSQSEIKHNDIDQSYLTLDEQQLLSSIIRPSARSAEMKVFSLEHSLAKIDRLRNMNLDNRLNLIRNQLRANSEAHQKIQDFFHNHQGISTESVAWKNDKGQRPFKAFYEKVQKLIKSKQLNNANRVAAELDPSMRHRAIVQDILDQIAGIDPATGTARNENNSHFCVHEASELGGSFDEAILEENMSTNELLVRIYKPTLAHEIGHNLGLRHNFIGSYDKANWKFSEDDDSSRNYSSIMDYQRDDHMTYDGLGPYDVYALRAAYTGYLELAQEQNGKKFIHVDEVLRSAGLQNWSELDTNAINRLGLKPMMFCSDEDAGLYPTCNRHDAGTTPQEIIDNIMKDYHELFAYNNFKGNKKELLRFENGMYIGRLFSMMLTMRQFLEETFYRAIILQEDYVDHFYAALKGMMRLKEIIHQPTNNSEDVITSNQRFQEVEVGSEQNKKKVKIQLKPLIDIDHDNVEGHEHLKVRGIEYDKVVAMMILTERNLGMPRYLGRSLVLSYYIMENIFLGINGPEESFVVQTLSELQRSELTPMVTDPDSPFDLLVPIIGHKEKYDSQVNQVLRFYANLQAIAAMDVDWGINVNDNPVNLFKTLLSRTPVEDAVMVKQPGASNSDFKYVAYNSSLASRVLIEEIASDSILEDAKGLMFDWYLKKYNLEAQREEDADVNEFPMSDSEIAEKEAREKLIKVFESIPDEHGSKDFDVLFANITQIFNYALQMTYQTIEVNSDGVPIGQNRERAAEISNQLRELSKQIKEQVKDDSILLSMFSAVEGAKIPLVQTASGPITLEFFDVVKPDKSEIDRKLSNNFESLNYLTRFFYMLNPQYLQ